MNKLVNSRNQEGTLRPKETSSYSRQPKELKVRPVFIPPHRGAGALEAGPLSGWILFRDVQELGLLCGMDTGWRMGLHTNTHAPSLSGLVT